MTAVSRLLVRSRASISSPALARTPARVAGVVRAVAPRSLSTAAVMRPRAVAQTAALRRWASSAAQEVEVEAEAEEPQWPERVLPTLTPKDVKRLERQRNIGM